MNAVDSPPGMTSPSSPSSCSGLRTSTMSAPRRRSIAACSRKLPWRARTPIVGAGLTSLAARRRRRLPAAGLEQLARLERGGGEADHRLAEAGGDARQHIAVAEVRRRLD